MRLTRYWINFDWKGSTEIPPGLHLGCGVTARDKGDALELVQQVIFRKDPMPNVISVIDEIDVSTLDPRHILPNLGNIHEYGIWFPLGFQGIKT